MGSVTEFRFKACLIKDTPKEVINILYKIINDRNTVADVPNVAFFQLSRAYSLLTCVDWYTRSGGKFYKKGNYWCLDLHTGFRNYDDEISHFLLWIQPYLVGRKIKRFLGWQQHEYSDDRTYIHLNQVTGQYYGYVATVYSWPEGFDPERVDGNFHMGFFEKNISDGFFIPIDVTPDGFKWAHAVLSYRSPAQLQLISSTVPPLQNFLHNHIAIWISKLPPIKPSAKWFGMSHYQFHFLSTGREPIGKPMIFGTMGDPVVDYASMFRNIWDTDHGLNETIKWKTTTEESFDGNTFGHRYYVDEAGMWEQPILKADVWEGEKPSYYGGIVIKPRRVGITREYLETDLRYNKIILSVKEAKTAPDTRPWESNKQNKGGKKNKKNRRY